MPVQADAGAGTVPGGGVARQELRAKASPRGALHLSSTLDPDIYKSPAFDAEGEVQSAEGRSPRRMQRDGA